MQAQIVFQNALGDSNCYEEGYGILPTTDHTGYLVSAAYNCGGGASDWKGKLIKINNAGDTVWTRKDLPANGFLRKGNDGSYLYVGGNHAGLAYDTVVITKTNEDGDTMWSRHLFLPQCNNLAYDLINTRDEGYAICGIYAPDCTTQTEMNSFVVKMDINGMVEWTTLLKGAGNDELFVIRQMQNGGYALFGWTDSKGAGLADRYLVMLNEHGDSVYSKTYGGPEADYGYGMDILPNNGGFITVGYTDSIYATKLSITGNEEWRVSLGVPTGSIYFKAMYTRDKHFAFIGCENDTVNFGCSATLYKTDTLGNLQWRKSIGGLVRDFAQDGPGSFLMAGYLNGVFPAKPKAYYVRFDTTYNPLDTLNTGVNEVLAEGANIYLKQNLLNRHEPIRFYTTSLDLVTISLYDVLGRRTLNITGRQEIMLPNPNESGIYLWQATVGGKMVSGKLMVQ